MQSGNHDLLASFFFVFKCKDSIVPLNFLRVCIAGSHAFCFFCVECKRIKINLVAEMCCTVQFHNLIEFSSTVKTQKKCNVVLNFQPCLVVHWKIRRLHKCYLLTPCSQKNLQSRNPDWHSCRACHKIVFIFL